MSQTFEHVSVIRTLQKRFKLPTLNERMAATADLSPCIDPALLDQPRRAPRLPAVKVPLQKLRAYRPQVISQPELWAVAEAGKYPAHLDRRAHSLAIAEHILDRGAQLGAIHLL